VLSDRIDHGRLLARGLAVAVGVVLWGLHKGLTQGCSPPWLPTPRRRSCAAPAFGMFNLVCGVAVLVASVTAGPLWERVGADVIFLAAAAFAVVALLGLQRLRGPFGITKTSRTANSR
jgi:hypothetical protein